MARLSASPHKRAQPQISIREESIPEAPAALTMPEEEDTHNVGDLQHSRTSDTSLVSFSSGASDSATPPKASQPSSRKSLHSGPLVLLHVHFLPLSESVQQLLRTHSSIIDHHVLERGMLLPHPGSDYTSIATGVLEAVGLRGEQKHEPDHDFHDQRTGELGIVQAKQDGITPGWTVQVFASSGLMTYEAWSVAWAEMERVDVALSHPDACTSSTPPLQIPTVEFMWKTETASHLATLQDQISTAQAALQDFAAQNEARANDMLSRLAELEAWRGYDTKRRQEHKIRLREKHERAKAFSAAVGAPPMLDAPPMQPPPQHAPPEEPTETFDEIPLEVLLGRYLCRKVLDVRNLVILLLLATTALLGYKAQTEVDVRADACQVLGRTIADTILAARTVEYADAVRVEPYDAVRLADEYALSTPGKEVVPDDEVVHTSGFLQVVVDEQAMATDAEAPGNIVATQAEVIAMTADDSKAMMPRAAYAIVSVSGLETSITVEQTVQVQTDERGLIPWVDMQYVML